MSRTGKPLSAVVRPNRCASISSPAPTATTSPPINPFTAVAEPVNASEKTIGRAILGTVFTRRPLLDAAGVTWQTDRIARISPQSGEVMGWIDLSGLLSSVYQRPKDAVLNGIAYDAAHKRLFVTGKLWPNVFEIKLTPKSRK